MLESQGPSKASLRERAGWRKRATSLMTGLSAIQRLSTDFIGRGTIGFEKSQMGAFWLIIY